jgi:ABC-type multidrug transport system fused ATPase/permease subunit
MVEPRLPDRPLLLGFVLGVVFGVVDLLLTWVAPLSDDSIPALLRFYGPMFFSWAFVSFRSVRRSGRLSTGVTTGFVVAFGTFCVFYVFNLLRVNLFLAELTGRTDWQNMMQRFRASGFHSLRVFVNIDYLKGAPFKIGVASVIGAVMGLVGGTLGRLKSAHFPARV